MEGEVLQIHLVELFLNTVLYHRHIYPDGIYRRRRAYSTFSFITIFPPLMDYFRRILEICQELIRTKSLTVVEIRLMSDNEVIECHELKLSQVKGWEKESGLELEERMKELLLRVESKLKPLKPLPKNTTFRVDLQTTPESLQKINNDCRFQDFPWIRNDQREGDHLLYNPVCIDEKLGVDIAINQRLDSIPV